MNLGEYFYTNGVGSLFESVALRTAVYLILLFACSRRKTIVCFEAASIRLKDDGVDEKQVTVVVDKHITIYGIKDVVLSVGVVFTIVLWMETQTYKLVIDFLLCGQPGFSNIWLNKYSTYTTILILGKAYHVVGASVKIAVVRFNTFKEKMSDYHRHSGNHSI